MTDFTFRNSDLIRHQMYSYSKAKIFTLKLYLGSSRMSAAFDKSGLVVPGRNIHDSIVGFIAAAPSPWPE